MAVDTFSRWAAVAVGFMLGSAMTASVGLAGLVWAWGHWAPAPDAHSTEAPTVYSRAEFNELIMGRGEKEVIAAVGKPDAASEDPETKYWHYFKRTKGPVTGAVDDDAQVVLRGGKVIAINY